MAQVKHPLSRLLVDIQACRWQQISKKQPISRTNTYPSLKNPQQNRSRRAPYGHLPYAHTAEHASEIGAGPDQHEGGDAHYNGIIPLPMIDDECVYARLKLFNIEAKV